MLRLLRTVCHLRPSQLFWRLRYSLERPWSSRLAGRWSWRGSSPPVLREAFPDLPLPEPPRPRGPAAVEMLAERRLELLNESRPFDADSPDWRLGERTSDRLWTVTLHYHAWAYALAETAATTSGETARQAASLVRRGLADWIRACAIERPGTAALAWNSYAVATRIGWWIRAYRLARSEIFAGHAALEGEFLRSLWQQAAYLNAHLEWDLRANHLIRDLVGLALAGRFFRHPRASTWLRRASALAVEQAAEQVLADGGDYERSPKYHLDVMGDLLQLALLTEDEPTRAVLRRTWTSMAEWIAWMRHPDGATAHFNDGAAVPAARIAHQVRSGERLGVGFDLAPRRGGRHLASSGFVVWHGDEWSVFLDVGPLGPDEQTGHGHADTLSIECSLRGRRLVVDPGTFGYDADERRRYDRSTRAHNTVCIDGRDSSELWHVFRAGRRARPRDVSVSFRADGFLAGAFHDGYDHLPGRPRHRRTLRLQDPGIFSIEDEVSGAGSHELEGGLLIEPAWEVRTDGAGWIAELDGLRVAIGVAGDDRPELFAEQRQYHPDYGSERRATRIGWRRRGPLPWSLRLILSAVS